MMPWPKIVTSETKRLMWEIFLKSYQEGGAKMAEE